MKLQRATGRTASEDIEHKKVLQEQAVKLEEMGQESEKKAAPLVIEEGKKTDREEKKYESRKLEELEKKSRFQFTNYKQHLAQTVGEIMRSKEVCPRGWLWDAWANEEGVGLTLLQEATKRKFIRAFRPINIPKYDLFACTELVWSAENTVEKVMRGNGHLGKQTESGILLS